MQRLRFGLQLEEVAESAECIAGLVLQGLRKPYDCPAFGTRCTPDTPLGRAHGFIRRRLCAAYFHFGRRKDDVDSLVSLAAASLLNGSCSPTVAAAGLLNQLIEDIFPPGFLERSAALHVTTEQCLQSRGGLATRNDDR